MVILDTGTRRRLMDSVYEERRDACRRAEATLGVSALRDATIEMVEDGRLDPIARRRARHVVTENARSTAFADHLESGSVSEAGELMDPSHDSLRDDFEVSSPALDTMVKIARSQPGCHGARMTGAGFAGCAVALVETGRLADFVECVAPAHDEGTGNIPKVYPTGAAGGVATVPLK